jgi:hypothetical protein
MSGAFRIVPSSQRAMYSRVAISQSDYIPWKGYFDLIGSVDAFILYDDVQYTRRDWRNRNLIKGPNGLFWLTIPVRTKARYKQKICETVVSDANWAERHWRSIELSYRKGQSFSEISPVLRQAYEQVSELDRLSDINAFLIQAISSILRVNTPIIDSRQYSSDGNKSVRLLHICQQLGAREYVCGPTSRSYLDEQLFQEHQIQVTYFDYSDYPTYPQLWGDFVHHVSIIDLILNTGQCAAKYMKLLHSKNRQAEGTRP